MGFISSIEIGRLIGLVGVVALHAASLGAYGDYERVAFVVDELARFAVPLFFLISGYLWSERYIRDARTSLARLFPRLAVPYVIWLVIYNGLGFSALLYPRTYYGRVLEYAAIPMTGGPGFHLWFLPALFIGTAIVLFSLRYLGERTTLILAALLYFAGASLWLAASLADRYPPTYLWRNGWFFAPLFLIVGHQMRDRALPPIGAFVLLAVFGAALQLAEGALFGNGYPRGHDMSFGTPLFAIGILGLVLRIRTDWPALVGWGRDVFGAYLVHVLVLRLLLFHIPERSIAAAIGFTIATTLISLVLTRLYRMAAASVPIPWRRSA